MKSTMKILSKSLFLFVTIFTFTACDLESEPKTVEKPEGIIISLEQAKKMYDTYTVRRKPLIQRYEDTVDARKNTDPKQLMEYQEESAQPGENQNNVEKFKVARYGDIDYKTLKQYLAYIEQEARNAGVKDISALRLYFANYPDQTNFSEDKENRIVKDPRRNTFIMIPTLKKGDKNYAFFTQGGDAGGRKPLLLNDSLEVIENDGLGFSVPLTGPRDKASFFPNAISMEAPFLQDHVKSTAGNHVGMQPPN